jgi:hypothetical protein
MWRNSTVCLVGSALALLGTGCFVDADHDHGRSYPPPGGTVVVSGAGQIAVSWDLAYLDGKFTDCESADTPTVVLHLEPRQAGPRFSAPFSCEAGGGVATNIAPGLYDIALDLQDARGRTVSTVEHPAVELFQNTTTELEEPAVLPVQTWDLLWTIGHRGTRALSCDDVGGRMIEFTAQLGGAPPDVYRLPCSDYGAVSTAIVPGDYQVRMLLIDQRGLAIGDTGVGRVNVTFDAPASLDADFDL